MAADLFLYFLIYSFIGWFWEGLITLFRDHRLVNRGFLIGPYCPIYGCGALLFIGIAHYTENPIAMFFLGGLLACVLEYITSFVMEKLFNARWWDYSKRPFNINGRVCLLGFAIFGLGAVAILYVHPYVAKFVELIEQKQIIVNILVAVFTFDVLATNQSIAKFTKILRDYQAMLKKGRFVQFIERKSGPIVQVINNRRRRIFTWQQRRILRAFPNFHSNYDKAYAELQKIYQKTRFKPLNQQKAHARKKSKKILK